MTFDGFSLFVFLLLAFAIPYSAGKLIMCSVSYTHLTLPTSDLV